jgi:hypothetical protein
LPPDQKTKREVDLPTGIDNSVRAFLPEPIYIPAVKDLADDIKTKDSASFGKLLGILLASIKPHLAHAEEFFRDLHNLLNKSVDETGAVTDNRLDAVKLVEGTVQKFVQENFPNVGIEIKIPPPELKTVLGSAEIIAFDGVSGALETKGDGLKRAVTFAILRSYVELRDAHPEDAEQTLGPSGYLFLFEEPELYLYPLAQRILFDALRTVAQRHHVIVSTHSPSFFEPTNTEAFVKMVKRGDGAPKPFGVAFPVDLSSLDTKTRFQLIGYETNNTAFFSERVLLVEGDSDFVVVPHLSAVLNPKWSFERSGIAVCRIHGKSSIRRYREFFRAFDVPVMVVGDLDCVLDGFDQCGLPQTCVELRSRLLQRVDCVIHTQGLEMGLASEELKKLAESPTRRQHWDRMRELATEVVTGKADPDAFAAEGRAFFDVEQDKTRLAVIREAADAEVLTLKRELLSAMRACGVFLWERGNIENYYPLGTLGQDKPSKAFDFCRRVRTREDAVALCSQVGDESEFDAMFSKMFANAVG